LMSGAVPTAGAVSTVLLMTSLHSFSMT
jgi:hypothetical protein